MRLMVPSITVSSYHRPGERLRGDSEISQRGCQIHRPSTAYTLEIYYLRFSSVKPVPFPVPLPSLPPPPPHPCAPHPPPPSPLIPSPSPRSHLPHISHSRAS